MIDDPWFYAVAIPAVLLCGISKGGFAGGLGIIAVPLMALVVPPLQAAGILLPILIFMDALGVWKYRHAWDRRDMRLLLLGAIAGIALGTATAQIVNENHIRLMVGVIALIFALNHWISRGESAPPKPRDKAKATLWGAISGFTSFVSHAGGPPLQVYMLPLKLDKTVYVGTSVVFFMVVNWAKLVPYAWLGQLAPGNLWTAALLLPLAPAGMYLGFWLHDIIPQKPFFRIVYILVFLVGLKLIWDGTTALLGN